MKRSPEVNPQIEDSAEKRRSFGVAIFGSGNDKNGPSIEKARALAVRFIEQGFSVNTGGYGGVMKAASEAALKATEELGVPADDRINAYLLKDLPSLTKKEVVAANKVRAKSYPERLANLIDGSKAFIVLNGGQGTVIELFATLEAERFNQLIEEGGSPKPIIIIDESLKMSDILSMTAASEGKVKSSDLVKNVFVLNLDPESVEITSQILENYYQRSIGCSSGIGDEEKFEKYNFGQYLENREKYSQGGGI